MQSLRSWHSDDHRVQITDDRSPHLEYHHRELMFSCHSRCSDSDAGLLGIVRRWERLLCTRSPASCNRDRGSPEFTSEVDLFGHRVALRPQRLFAAAFFVFAGGHGSPPNSQSWRGKLAKHPDRRSRLSRDFRFRRVLFKRVESALAR